MASPGYTLYTAGTPNGFKASIVLEEVGVPYKTVPISFAENEQKSDWFVKINPNGRIPALVDHSEGDLSVWESGSIMLYLARKHPEAKLLGTGLKEETQITSWLMFQMGGQGPMQGQANHFIRYAPVKIGYGMRRYQEETKRLYSILEAALADGQDWLVGGSFSLADAANFPWVTFAPWAGVDLKEFPQLSAWAQRCYARPAVKKGLAVPETGQSPGGMAVKFMEDQAEADAKFQEARQIMEEAGAFEAADSANAAFSKK